LLYTTLGDILQITNPITAYIVTDDRERFLTNYVIGMFGSHVIKTIGHRTHFKGSLRPDKSDHKGMPSGHTTSAMLAASSMTEPKYRWPLYITAAITGHSRIVAKKHSLLQVLGAVVLSETVVFLNDKLTKDKVLFTLMPNGCKFTISF